MAQSRAIVERCARIDQSDHDALIFKLDRTAKRRLLAAVADCEVDAARDRDVSDIVALVSNRCVTRRLKKHTADTIDICIGIDQHCDNAFRAITPFPIIEATRSESRAPIAATSSIISRRYPLTMSLQRRVHGVIHGRNRKATVLAASRGDNRGRRHHTHHSAAVLALTPAHH